MIKENYNLIEKYLHYFILNNKIISELIFDLEKKIFLKKKNYADEKHIFISGLARSGSTLLLNILYQSGNFCSLTYNDMPMILAPNLWSKFIGRKKKNFKLEKRAHQDLVNINIYSPESFEEVFWKYILKNKYIDKNLIKDIKIPEKIIVEYSRYINLICEKNKKNNYLSKNNNSLFRIEKILNFFQNSYFIIPFRDPYTHAYSLLSQHQRFIKLQKNNYFIKDYMNWLGHHEFGLNHKTFDFKQKNNLNLNKNSINYWIKIWIDYYTYVLNNYKKSKNQKRIILVNYNKLCDNKNNILKSLSDNIGIDELNNKIKITSQKKQIKIECDNLLLEKANKIYSKL